VVVVVSSLIITIRLISVSVLSVRSALDTITSVRLRVQAEIEDIPAYSELLESFNFNYNFNY
jgi:hypothetical protein